MHMIQNIYFFCNLNFYQNEIFSFIYVCFQHYDTAIVTLVRLCTVYLSRVCVCVCVCVYFFKLYCCLSKIITVMTTVIMGHAQWLMPVIPTRQEAEVGGLHGAQELDTTWAI